MNLLEGKPLSLALADGLADLGGGVIRLADAQRAGIVSRAKLRHVKYHSTASSLGALAARKALRAYNPPGSPPITDPRLGVLAAGGVSHLAIQWQATHTIAASGPDMLSPLLFPHTIPSAMPCAVAAA